MSLALPAEAAASLSMHLSLSPWFRGVTIIDVGPNATLEIRTTSLEEYQAFIHKIGTRWSGYPMRARKVVG